MKRLATTICLTIAVLFGSAGLSLSCPSVCNCIGYEGENIPSTEEECIMTAMYDNRLNTETSNYNLSMNHSFDFIYDHNISISFYNSGKQDNLFNSRVFLDSGDLDDSYISPRSKSNNFSFISWVCSCIPKPKCSYWGVNYRITFIKNIILYFLLNIKRD